MPPRTANSPRRSTRSARVYAAAASASTTSSSGARRRPAAHRLEVAEPGDERLEHGAHRGDDDRQRAVCGVVGVGVGEPAQDGQPPADGVAARAEPLVRQGLPGREVGDRRRAGAAEGGGEVVGLARWR